MKDIAKGLVYMGIFAIPFIPLIISNSMFFPFITGKNFTFRILVEIVFIAWIILAAYEPAYRPKRSAIALSFLLFLVVMFVANINGQYPLKSFWSNFERMEGYVTLVHTFAYMLVLGSVFTTQKIWDRYFMTIIGSAMILSLYAFAQLSGNIVINQGGGRLDGTLGNSAYMAIYTLFLIFITFFMLLRTQSKGMRYGYSALILLFMYLLLQTATRGTVLGLVGGMFIAVSYIALLIKSHPHVRKYAVGGLVAIVASVTLFITFKESSFIQGNPYLARIATISLKEGSNRFEIWSMAFEGVKERPLLGWGQGNYNYVFNKYYEPELHGGEAWFDRVHNIVMDWLIAGGFIGAVAYFSILGSAVYYLFFRPLFKKDDEAFTVVERGVLLGILAGYTVHNLFVFDNIVSYVFYGTILAYIHSRTSTGIPALERWKIDVRVVEQVVVPVMTILLVITVYFVNVPAIQASKDIINAFRAKDPNEMLKNFDIALARNSFGNQEIREQLTQRAQSVFQDPNAPEALKQKTFKRVEEELQKQIEEKPNDARVEVFISSFYRMTNNLDQAVTHLEKARSLSPRKQLIIFEQGTVALQKQEFEKATEFFKEAYELGPQFIESRVYYATALVYGGQLGLVGDLIQTEEQKNAFAVNENAVRAVYQAKMYPMLKDMFARQIVLNPNNGQVRTNLAYVLSETGDTAGAIDVLTKAGEDIPSFKEQADQFIATIKNEDPATPTVEINGQKVQTE
ncbi:MAG: O-antigen ligase family protein [Candidatus Pacebacteria bacterium]|nr:O-antigen ligase family protein [Candidatus Paceibacterota bacterium]MCF7856961.1 O-antigen ligase family protein [Candidatus Paceibacterota bacterium]